MLNVDDQTDVGGRAMPTGIGLNYMPKKNINTVHDGDSRSDIKSGRSAGMKTIAVLSGFDDLQALSKEFPDAVIDSVAQLKGIIY